MIEQANKPSNLVGTKGLTSYQADFFEVDDQIELDKTRDIWVGV